ncbi:MAG: hypothetical protein IPJ77_13585 [Planctomycetes bacterium]|nr:hypothetical protein [Planctomycetota bacterium]
MRGTILFALLPLLLPACKTAESSLSGDAAQRAHADAEPHARELAESVVANLGGWNGWERTRFIEWSFFGGRRHVWDKATGDWRLEDAGNVVLMNVNTRVGRVFESGGEVFDPVRKKELLDQAWGKWINDSYWMFLPWKLLDPGVKLRHVGAGALANGQAAQVLELTFEQVGLTPKNRYLVYVGDESGLVEQWSFFPDAGDEKPRFTLPWTGWKRFGRILLCTDHGDLPGRERKDWKIAVHTELPRAVFESATP